MGAGRLMRWEIGSQVGVKQDCNVLPLMTQKGQDGTGNLQSSFTKGRANKTEVCMLRTLAKKLVGGHNDKCECGASRILRVCICYIYVQEWIGRVNDKGRQR